MDRRGFFRRAAVGSSALLAPSLTGLAACSEDNGVGPSRVRGYGPLARSSDAPELFVAEGFTIAKLSASLAPSRVNPGFAVPQAHDGMAAFSLPNGNVRLIRNHEIRDSVANALPLGSPARSYDTKAGGGTTSLEVKQGRDGSVELVAEFVSLSGTHVNCAGGPTPWGSWISCEETTEGPTQGRLRAHGYCFEVPASATSEVDPVPLKAMGRFTHEAIAIDPASGIVYETEDLSYNAAARRGSGFYRFLPASPGNLAAGGRLQMLAVRDQPNFNTITGQQVGASLPTAWVDIPNPDPVEAETNAAAVFQQGWARGAAVFQRLEGCWYGDGNIYFNATSGGNAGAGQVWAFRPLGGDSGQLTLIFESPSTEVLDSPDNICVSPRGGLVLCEDGDAVQYLRGLTRQGQLFDFVRSAGESAELAGACFSPNGRTLFFNIQGSTSRLGTRAGGTYAVWGPWEDGAL